MKFIKLILFITVIFCVYYLYVSRKQQHSVNQSTNNTPVSKSIKQNIFNGAINLKGQKFDDLTINGAARLQHITVIGKTALNGSALLNQCTVNDLNINGSLEINHSIVVGKLNASGSFEAENTVFADQITIGTTQLFLDHCKTKNITIKKTIPYKQQIIELINTQVDGDIEFEQPGGRVLLENESHITGNVINGEVSKK